MKAEYEQTLASIKPQHEQDEGYPAWIQKRRKLGGRPRAEEQTVLQEHRGLLGGKKSNRRQVAEPPRKREMTAQEKLEIANFIEEQKQSCADEGELYQIASHKYGLDKRRLRDMHARMAEWHTLTTKLGVGTQGGAKRGSKAKRIRSRRGIRALGGGRKNDFAEEIEKLGKWLSEERSNGHNISKREAREEFYCLLVARSERCLVQAQQSTDELQKKLWELEAAKSLERKKKLQNSKSYAQSYTDDLLKWMGAKFMAKEQTTPLAPLEQKQSIDHKLWLMGAAPKEELESAQIVSDVDQVISNRHRLCIGMSDQVSVWAKSPSTRVVFAKEDLQGVGAEVRREFNTCREELKAAQEAWKEGGLQLVTGTDGGESAGKRVAGSRVLKGDSAAEKFRITYEARQRVTNIANKEELQGQVLPGLLVFPGKHNRLSNVDENCKYKRTEKFEVKGVEVEHQAGQKCRGLAWAVELRKQFPKEFEEVEIMTQPSSNCDGVLLAWIVEEQCEEEICSLWIRDCFSAVFQEQVVQRQFTGCQASAQILGKMTQQLQLTDTDFAKSFKASFRSSLRSKD